MDLSVSVVVPVYGNTATLAELHRRLSSMAAGVDAPFEFIFVDDAGPPDTWAELARLAALDDRVTALRLTTNVRQTRAIFAGFAIASGNALVAIDADLEEPPEFVADLVRAYQQGHDLVYTRRTGRPQSATRAIGSIAINLAARLVGIRLDDVGAAFVIMSPGVAAEARSVLERTGAQIILPAIVAAARNPVCLTVDLTGIEPQPSQYSTRALGRIAWDFLASFALAPLARRVRCGAALGALVAVGRVRAGRPWRRWAGAATAALALSRWWTLLASRDRRDRTQPLYEVAERVGGDPSSGAPPALRADDL